MRLTVLLAIGGTLLAASAVTARHFLSPPATALAPSQAASMHLRKATFAAGCFWGVEAAFAKLRGVESTCVGYSGGHTDHPTYGQLSTFRTGHAESVSVCYDPAKVSYAELLDVFWSCHDPTRDQGQGPDGGPHRSVIFFHDPEQEALARESLKELEESAAFKRRIATEVVPAATFYPAEDYHQHYLEKQGITQPCHLGAAVVHTRLARQAAQDRKTAAAPQPSQRRLGSG